MRLTIEEIKGMFLKEYSFLKSGQVEILELKPDQFKSKDIARIWFPGVYVFWCGGEVWKVGRSLDNARKHALTHFEEHTGKSQGKDIYDLEDNPETRLILFTFEPENKNNDRHWLCALEVFFEENLVPLIRVKHKY